MLSSLCNVFSEMIHVLNSVSWFQPSKRWGPQFVCIFFVTSELRTWWTDLVDSSSLHHFSFQVKKLTFSPIFFSSSSSFYFDDCFIFCWKTYIVCFRVCWQFPICHNKRSEIYSWAWGHYQIWIHLRSLLRTYSGHNELLVGVTSYIFISIVYLKYTPSHCFRYINHLKSRRYLL